MNNLIAFAREQSTGGVSVPLRGKYRGEYHGCIVRLFNPEYGFPSPCGVNIVANEHDSRRNLFAVLVSVPLRGKYRGESVKYVTSSTTVIGFRPLAG